MTIARASGVDGGRGGRRAGVRSLLASLLVGSLGCTGAIGSGEPGEDGGVGSGPGSVPSTDAFACTDAMHPAAVPMRRLSRVQLEATFRDLVAFALPTDATGQGAVIGAMAPAIALLPDDDREGPNDHWGGFSRVDQTVNQEHVERSYALAEILGRELTTGDRLEELAGACATDADDANDDACLDAFIRKFGERALRKAVTDDDVAFYRVVAGEAPFEAADWADVVASIAIAPHALYFVEHGDAEVGGETFAVDSYELASRLSYHFWQTAPDDRLFQLAREGKLTDEATYAAEVERVFADPRTRDSIRAFYAEWMQRDDLAELNSRTGTPAFDTLRGTMDPSGDLREAMFDEVADMALYYSLDEGGTLADFYRSDRSFARSSELADLYGVAPWDGESEPPAFTDGRRGLLTRGAMVATGSANTRPVMKGVFIRRALLCDELAPPPADVMAVVPELTGVATVRETVTALTETGTCAGCHTLQINGLGYATEGFDSLGRRRTEELLIDGLSGAMMGQKAVDVASVPRVDIADETPVSGPDELQDRIVDSGKLESCFARVYFRYTFGRAEDVERDGCVLADMHGGMLDGETLEETLRRLALQPSFRQKNFAEEAE